MDVALKVLELWTLLQYIFVSILVLMDVALKGFGGITDIRK